MLQQGSFTVVSGSKARRMGKVTLKCQKKSIFMELLIKALRKVLVFKLSQMETNTKDNTKMANSMEKGSTHGQMDLVMRVSLLKEPDKVMEIGNQPGKTEISTLGLMKGIRKMDMADMYGRMDVFTRVDFQKTSSISFFM